MPNVKQNNDGVKLYGLGECTLDDVFNDPNGLDYAVADSEYYYVFPKYKRGYCGDSFWMINKNDISRVSFSSMTMLIIDAPHVLERLDKLNCISIDDLKRKLKRAS